MCFFSLFFFSLPISFSVFFCQLFERLLPFHFLFFDGDRLHLLFFFLSCSHPDPLVSPLEGHIIGSPARHFGAARPRHLRYLFHLQPHLRQGLGPRQNLLLFCSHPRKWLHFPRPFRVIRARPTVLQIQIIPQQIVPLLPPRRRRIVVFFSTDMIVRNKKMQVRPFSVFSPMFDDENTKVLVAQSGPCRPLKVLDDFFNLLLCRLVLRPKSNHGRRVTIFVVQTVRQVGKKYRLPPSHDYLFGLSFPQKIFRRFLPRPPRPYEFDMHGLTLP